MGFLALGQRPRIGPRHRLRTAHGIVVTIGPWSRIPGMASMVITGAHEPQIEESVTVSSVHGWLSAVARRGFTSVRTNALSAGLARTLLSAGFSVAQNLRLLERQTDDWTSAHDTNAAIREMNPYRPVFPRGRTVGLLNEALRIDGASFPPQWSLDEESMRDALRATPTTRMFVAGDDTNSYGFVIVGLNGRDAYVQRLAVDPAHRRFGWATGLMTRALNWATDNGAKRVFVNTETDNAGALSLYQRLGFRATAHDLFVLHRVVP